MKETQDMLKEKALYRPQEKTEQTETIAKQIDALRFEVKHLRDPIAHKDEKNWQNIADAWLYIFPNGITQEFYTGVGHRATKHGRSFPVKPDIYSLLSSLAMDSSAENEPFAHWCANFGYDEDSRKALETYTACQKSADILRKLGFKDLEALREFFQDY